MKFFLLIMWAVIFLLILYYITWAIHMFVPIFGKWVDPMKAMIPFYGWIKLIEGPKFY